MKYCLSTGVPELVSCKPGDAVAILCHFGEEKAQYRRKEGEEMGSRWRQE